MCKTISSCMEDHYFLYFVVFSRAELNDLFFKSLLQRVQILRFRRVHKVGL